MGALRQRADAGHGEDRRGHTAAAHRARRFLRPPLGQCRDHRGRILDAGQAVPEACGPMIAEITEEQLLELQRMAALGRLLASVAHEFSAPVASILSNTEIEMRLIERLDKALAEPSSGSAKELVASCRSLVQVDRLACERITALVKSLKTSARAGDAEIQRVNVNEIAEAALQLAKTEFKGRVGVET